MLEPILNCPVMISYECFRNSLLKFNVMKVVDLHSETVKKSIGFYILFKVFFSLLNDLLIKGLRSLKLKCIIVGKFL